MMLLAEAFVHLLELYDIGKLELPLNMLRERLPVVLIQIVNRTLFTQSHNGSWGTSESIETTAYGILTLAAVSSLPWFVQLRGQMKHAIEAGQIFLNQAQSRQLSLHYLWIEKVTYGSHILCESYCLAALRPSISFHTWSPRVSNLTHISEKSVLKFSKLVSTLNAYKDQPFWRLQASAMEGHTFLPLLNLNSTNALLQQEKAKNEYFNFIPCTWALINNQKHLFLPANLLWDMMVLTTYNFRIDEYMENMVAKYSNASLERIKSIIPTLFAPEQDAGTNGTKRPLEDSVISEISSGHPSKITEADLFEMADFKSTVRSYIRSMLGYARIQQASLTDQKHFSDELQAFLLSHIAQTEDNARFSNSLHNSGKGIIASARTPYYTWAHTIGAVSVSCPMSFAFFTCLLGASISPKVDSGNCFSTIHRTYLAHDLCSHLAVMSRMYNDYGSFARDQIEANINSVNFPEFHNTVDDEWHTPSDGHHGPQGWAQPKKDLLVLAQYERAMAETVGDKLLFDLRSSGLRKNSSKAASIELFMDVTALYADMYVARDLSNYIDKRND